MSKQSTDSSMPVATTISTSFSSWITCTKNAICFPTSTLNIFWVVATTLCLWFLLIRSPVALRRRTDIPTILWLHLIGVYSVYLGCVHNTLLTPSVIGPMWHIWVGRVAMILGVMGFVTGFIYAWWKIAATDLGFCIGVSIGGIGQMIAQTNGYLNIKKYQRLRQQIRLSLLQQQHPTTVDDDDDNNNNNNNNIEELYNEMYNALEQHIENMISLFLLACGIPAMVRLAEDSNQLAITLPLLIGAAYVIAILYVKTFYRKIRTQRVLQMETTGGKVNQNNNNYTVNNYDQINYYGATD